MLETSVLRLSAFTVDPAGGNPAGVVISPSHPSDLEMQAIAAHVGYSETAFLAPVGDRAYRVRYFSPLAEVPFCGHATIAAAVAITERSGPGSFRFDTNNGPVAIETRPTSEGLIEATLTSVPPRVEPAADALVDAALSCLDWTRGELDPRLPPARAFAGAWHLVLAVQERVTLDSMRYDFEKLRALMLAEDLTTLQLVWQAGPTTYRVRDPFPVGGVVEDPATGAGAAAFGAYLREHGLIVAPATITILQGEEIGRPSRLRVEIVPDQAGIRVSGTAVPID
ncbi:MAG: PhzF family phenazine biosynthesis isomerase [Candidatus Limnocylindrales bacterium]